MSNKSNKMIFVRCGWSAETYPGQCHKKFPDRQSYQTHLFTEHGHPHAAQAADKAFTTAENAARTGSTPNSNPVKSVSESSAQQSSSAAEVASALRNYLEIVQQTEVGRAGMVYVETVGESTIKKQLKEEVEEELSK